jgi:hypothetical protein
MDIDPVTKVELAALDVSGHAVAGRPERHSINSFGRHFLAFGVEGHVGIVAQVEEIERHTSLLVRRERGMSLSHREAQARLDDAAKARETGLRFKS